MSSRKPLFGTCCLVLLLDPFWQPLSCPPGGLLFASAIMSSWLPTLVNNYHVLVLNPTWYLPSCPPGDSLSYSWYSSSCPQGAPLLLPAIMLPPTPPRSPQSFPLMPDFFYTSKYVLLVAVSLLPISRPLAVNIMSSFCPHSWYQPSSPSHLHNYHKKKLS